MRVYLLLGTLYMEYFSIALPGTRPIQIMFCPKLVTALHYFHQRIGANSIALSFLTKNMKSQNALNEIIFRSTDREALNDFKENEAKAALEELNLPSQLEIKTEDEPFPSFYRLRRDDLSPSQLNQKVDFIFKKGHSDSKEGLEKELKTYYENRFIETCRKTPFLTLKMKSKSNGHDYKLLIAAAAKETKLDSFGLYRAAG